MQLVKWFATRGISPETLQRNGIMEEQQKFKNMSSTCIAFPYERNKKLLNIKYRNLQKQFRQVRQLWSDLM